jgi:protein TonB
MWVAFSVVVVHALFLLTIMGMRVPFSRTDDQPIFVTIELGATEPALNDANTKESDQTVKEDLEYVAPSAVSAPRSESSSDSLTPSADIVLAEQNDMQLSKPTIPQVDKRAEKLADKPMDKAVDKVVKSPTKRAPNKVASAPPSVSAVPAKDGIADTSGKATDNSPTPQIASIASSLGDISSSAPVFVTHLDYRSQPPQPVYPNAAVRSKLQGKVVVRLLIGTRGEVVSASVLQSAGSALLDQAALDAALKAEFIPYARDGRVYQALADVPFEFVLKAR